MALKGPRTGSYTNAVNLRYNFNRLPVADFVTAQTPIPPDEYFKNTSLLISKSVTNGAQNNTFLDSSNNNFTITRNGNATQGSLSPFSQTGWSNYFDGNGDYLSVASNAAFAIGTSDFTIDLFAYYTAFTQVDAMGMANWDGITWGANKWSLHLDHATQRYKISFWVHNFNASTQMLLSTSTIQLNQWYHIAITRNGSTWRLFVNGVQEASATSSASIDGGNNSPIYIGGGGAGTQPFNGYLSNARLVRNSAVYTSAFTPSTSPLTAIENTVLLTCQSNRFIDNSTNNFTITKNGDTSVESFSPFAPIDSYSTSVVGGSGYFDGTGDYLTLASNAAFTFGTGDFTIEGWHYLTAAASSTKYLFDCRSGGGVQAAPLLLIQDSAYQYYVNGAYVALGGTPVRDVWTHFALVKTSGSTKLYVNGVVVFTYTDSINYTSSTFRIGSEWSAAGTFDWQGHISNMRVVKGTAVYTGNFTPPAAPILVSGSSTPYTSTSNVNTTFASANTSLLCNFTNAGIFDATSRNVMETFGNAQASTTQKKFGDTSIYFDGTGDYLFNRSSVNYAMGVGDFTIELWYYPVTTNNSDPTVLGNYDTTWQSGRYAFHAPHSANANKYSFWVNNYASGAAILVSTTNISLNNWVHLAITRSGNTWRLFINGTVESTVTSSVSLDNGTGGDGFWIGANFYPGLGGRYINAYIDDFRITKGYARYTANFTPPTRTFSLR